MKWIDEAVIPGDPMTYMRLLEEKGILCRSSGELLLGFVYFIYRRFIEGNSMKLVLGGGYYCKSIIV